MNLQEVCLTCAKQCGIQKFQIEGRILSDLAFILKGHLPVATSRTEWLCQTCLEQLSQAVKFVRQAIQGHETLVSNYEIKEEVPDEEGGGFFTIKQFHAHPKKEVVIDTTPKDEELKTIVYLENVKDPELLMNQDVIYRKAKVPEAVKYICYTCWKEFSTKNYLNKHRQRVHNPNRKPKHQCQICQKYFMTKQGLVYHLKIHAGEKHLPRNPDNLQCNDCGKSFRFRENFVTHMRIHTDSENPTEHCKICNIKFNAKSYKNHLLRVHPVGKLWPCDQCSNQFTDRQYLREHKNRIHLDIRYTCDFCGVSYKAKKALRTHMLMQHVGKVLNPCPHCQKTFSTKPKLRRHLSSHIAAQRKLDEKLKAVLKEGDNGGL